MSTNPIESFSRSPSHSQPMIPLPAPHHRCDFIFARPSSLLPPGCQRPEAYLTALLGALQATGLSDCCNKLHISPGTHSEYNRRQVPSSISRRASSQEPVVRMKWAMCNLPRRLVSHETWEIRWRLLKKSGERRFFQVCFIFSGLAPLLHTNATILFLALFTAGVQYFVRCGFYG